MIDRTDILREHNIQPSVQRRIIYEWLTSHPIHPTVNDIYSALSHSLPHLSRATVYNVMRTFVDHGLAQRVYTDDGEVRFDGNPKPHVHFKCLDCGSVFDLADIDVRAKPMQVPDGFTPIVSTITHWGLCPACTAMRQRKLEEVEEQPYKATSSSSTK